MKITSVNTYFVRPRWGFVEIETDEGITGQGDWLEVNLPQLNMHQMVLFQY